MATIFIAGRVGNNAEIKNINGVQYTSFSVAEGYRRKDQNGNSIEQTKWFNCLKSSTAIAPFIVKGMFIVVEGQLDEKAYIDKNGEAKPSITVFAHKITLGPSTQKQHLPETGNNYQENKPEHSVQNQAYSTHNNYPPNIPDQDDDLPF